MLGVEIGQIVLNKYRLERVLGEGGFGVVLEAMHLELGQRVAIKFLLPDALHSPELRVRFLREAQAAARLRSQHVARVLDIGHLESGFPYLVMEYLEGQDLAATVASRGPVGVGIAAAWIIQACDAIGEAHALGIVHRDLKPSNLFLARGGGGAEIVKVLDFGISKVPVESGPDFLVTKTTAVMGTPTYASPEQLRISKHVDHRADIWALGVTLYQLVSGQVPWSASALADLAIQIAMDPIRPLSPALGVPAAFCRVIDRCLEKDPARRFPDTASLCLALAPFARSTARGVPAGGYLGTMGQPGKPAVTSLASAAGQLQATPRPRFRAAGGLAAIGVVVGAAVLVGIFAANGGAPPTPTKVPVPPPLVVVPPPPKEEPDAGLPATSVTGVADAGVPSPDQRYQALVGDADQLAARGQWTDAMRAYRDALAIDPDRPEGNFGVAEAYRHLKKPALAIAHYRRYLERAPRGPKVAAARREIESLTAPGRIQSTQSDRDLFGVGKGD